MACIIISEYVLLCCHGFSRKFRNTTKVNTQEVDTKNFVKKQPTKGNFTERD